MSSTSQQFTREWADEPLDEWGLKANADEYQTESHPSTGLFERHKRWKEGVKLKVKGLEQEVRSEELRECTFTPQFIDKSNLRASKAYKEMLQSASSQLKKDIRSSKMQTLHTVEKENCAFNRHLTRQAAARKMKEEKEKAHSKGQKWKRGKTAPAPFDLSCYNPKFCSYDGSWSHRLPEGVEAPPKAAMFTTPADQRMRTREMPTSAKKRKSKDEHSVLSNSNKKITRKEKTKGKASKNKSRKAGSDGDLTTPSPSGLSPWSHTSDSEGHDRDERGRDSTFVNSFYVSPSIADRTQHSSGSPLEDSLPENIRGNGVGGRAGVEGHKSRRPNDESNDAVADVGAGPSGGMTLQSIERDLRASAIASSLIESSAFPNAVPPVQTSMNSYHSSSPHPLSPVPPSDEAVGSGGPEWRRFVPRRGQDGPATSLPEVQQLIKIEPTADSGSLATHVASLRGLREKVINEIGINQVREIELKETEAVYRIEMLKSHQEQVDATNGQSVVKPVEDERRWRDLRQHYENAIFLLQTDPKYIQRLNISPLPDDSVGDVAHVLLSAVFPSSSRRAQESLLYLFKGLIGDCVEKQKDSSTLRRPYKEFPLLRALLMAYSLRCEEFLQEVLGPPLASLLEEDDIRLNISDPDDEVSQQVKESRANLLKSMTKTVVDRIANCVERFPYGVRWLCGQMRATVESQGLGEEHWLSLVMHFVILLIINPAIMNPRGVGIACPLEFSPVMGQNCYLIAKVILHLSTGKLFSSNDSLNALNPFVLELKEKMKYIFFRLTEVDLRCTTSSPVERVGTHQVPLGDIVKLHDILWRYKKFMCYDDSETFTVVVNNLGPMPASPKYIVTESNDGEEPSAKLLHWLDTLLQHELAVSSVALMPGGGAQQAEASLSPYEHVKIAVQDALRVIDDVRPSTRDEVIAVLEQAKLDAVDKRRGDIVGRIDLALRRLRTFSEVVLSDRSADKADTALGDDEDDGSDDEAIFDSQRVIADIFDDFHKRMSTRCVLLQESSSLNEILNEVLSHRDYLQMKIRLYKQALSSPESPKASCQENSAQNQREAKLPKLHPAMQKFPFLTLEKDRVINASSIPLAIRKAVKIKLKTVDGENFNISATFKRKVIWKAHFHVDELEQAHEEQKAELRFQEIKFNLEPFLELLDKVRLKFYSQVEFPN